MAAEGLISERQAELLKSAVQRIEIAENTSTIKPRQWALPVLIVGFLVLLGLMFFSGNPEPETIQNVSETLNQAGSTGKMNRQLSTTLGIALLLIIPLIIIVWLYNSIVNKEEKTMESWAQVEAAYQRRADLVPMLIETVSKFMKHEIKTLEQVTNARSNNLADTQEDIQRLILSQKNATDMLNEHIGKVPTDDAKLESLAKAQATVSKNMHQIFAVAESYPQLRSQENFIALQDQLEGTENRINTVRMIFNEAAGEYNAAIRRLPGSLIASIGNFKRKAYFKADETADKKPDLHFED